MYYYAVLNDNDIVTDVMESPFPAPSSYTNYISIDSLDESLIGMFYNRTTETFEEVPVISCDTSNVSYKNTSVTLTAKLDSIDNDIEDLQGDAHTHTNKAALDTITAANIQTWNSGGTSGADGASAYEIAVANGFTGNVTEWLASLNGADGQDGADGTTVTVGTTTTATAGSNASVTSTLDSDTNTITLNFAIPRGADGADGQDGTGADITASTILDRIKTVDGSGSGLDADLLDGLNSTDFATANHTHTEYATAGHTHAMTDVTGLANAIDGKADSTHSHAISDITDLASNLSGKAASAHTHAMTDVTGLSDALNGKASSTHTHSNYVTLDTLEDTVSTIDNALDGKASTNHTHTASSIGAATASHTHTPSSIGAAATNHTHSGYLSTSGGTVSGDLNVTGVIKAAGQQMLYYSGSAQTIGTNNATGGTSIACGSSANVVVNGANLMAANVCPRNSGSFTLGTSSNRWTNIYSKANVNVSSDLRLKENIKRIDSKECFDYINSIDVKSFNFKADSEKQDNIGVIAQELQQIDPDFAKYFVSQDAQGYYGVTTANLVFPLIEYVKTLNWRILALEAKIK